MTNFETPDSIRRRELYGRLAHSVLRSMVLNIVHCPTSGWKIVSLWAGLMMLLCIGYEAFDAGQSLVDKYGDINQSSTAVT